MGRVSRGAQLRLARRAPEYSQRTGARVGEVAEGPVFVDSHRSIRADHHEALCPIPCREVRLLPVLVLDSPPRPVFSLPVGRTEGMAFKGRVSGDRGCWGNQAKSPCCSKRDCQQTSHKGLLSPWVGGRIQPPNSDPMGSPSVRSSVGSTEIGGGNVSPAPLVDRVEAIPDPAPDCAREQGCRKGSRESGAFGSSP